MSVLLCSFIEVVHDVMAAKRTLGSGAYSVNVNRFSAVSDKEKWVWCQHMK